MPRRQRRLARGRVGSAALALALATCAAAAGSLAPAARADTVRLADGTTLEGKLVRVTERGSITLQLASGERRTFEQAELESFTGDEVGAASYVRFARYHAGWSRLEVLARTFERDEAGPAPGREAPRPRRVALVGVVHIGDLPYYRRLQAKLDAHDLVLFEGVGAGRARFDGEVLPSPAVRAAERARPFAPPRDAPGDPGDALSALDPLTALQGGMASWLDVSFQKDGLDYDRSWWYPADVSTAELGRLFRESEASVLGELLSARARQRQAAANRVLAEALADTLAGFVTGKPARIVLKESFAKLLASEVGSLGGAGARGDGDGDEEAPRAHGLIDGVLIAARNDVVAEALDDALVSLPEARSIAIFYGAGHNADLERRLIARGFRAVEDEWLGAWEIRSAARPLFGDRARPAPPSAPPDAPPAAPPAAPPTAPPAVPDGR